MYYVGEKFNTAENKEYKTRAAALKAAAKGGKVFDADGNEIVREGEREACAGKIKIVFDGKVRIRNTAAFEENNVVGYAKTGDIIDIVDTVVMPEAPFYQTADGNYISAAPELTERVE